MKRRFLFLGSTRRRPVAFGRWPNALQYEHAKWRKLFAASCRELQAGSLCSPERGVRLIGTWLVSGIFVAILLASFAQPSDAITLETVLQTTLKKNPAIQEAKSGLEQAAGQRLVFRSVVWPDIELGVPAGVQGGHRAGESGIKGFAVGRGVLTQTLFNAGLPASLRRGDVEVLIAQQQLNVAVVEQLHAARLAFYTALYNRSLESIRREQQRVQASELATQIEGAHRAYLGAQLELASAMGIDPAKASLPEPEGELQSTPMRVDLDSETAAALQRRADLRLARLFVRAANEDQRIIAADYYPIVIGSFPGEYVPVTGIHREGSTSRNQDFIGSEIRERAAYTWRVIDDGKVRGAVLRARSAREINELTCRKLEANIPGELSRIANDLKTTEVREKSLVSAATAAEESARAVQENLASGLASPLEYRVTQNAFLETKSGLLDAIYQHNLAVAEWDRATGRYFQFSDDTAQNVH